MLLESILFKKHLSEERYLLSSVCHRHHLASPLLSTPSRHKQFRAAASPKAPSLAEQSSRPPKGTRRQIKPLRNRTG